MDLTVIIPTHNPTPARFAAVLAALAQQTLDPGLWETVIVDNASVPPLDLASLANPQLAQTRLVAEAQPGLTAARRRGIAEARGRICVFVDDDNALAPDYLANVLAIFAAHSRVGLAGGKSLPQFESEPPAWSREFFSLLALRDLGDDEIVSHGLRPPGAARNEYPACAPIGAGMAARVDALQPWLERPPTLSDRRGAELTSSGDNDIVLCALQAGWEVGYFPQLRLTHLIPAARLDPGYLARLNRGIQRSWQQVLALHDASAWPPLHPSDAALRKAKAWFTHRGWSHPGGFIRWQGACGHFDGRIAS